METGSVKDESWTREKEGCGKSKSNLQRKSICVRDLEGLPNPREDTLWSPRCTEDRRVYGET